MSVHLPETHLAHVIDILRGHLPRKYEAYAFCSRATGLNVKPFSDLDVCLRGHDAVPADTMLGLIEAFADRDLPISVDVVDWHRISDEFKQVIGPQLMMWRLHGMASRASPARWTR